MRLEPSGLPAGVSLLRPVPRMEQDAALETGATLPRTNSSPKPGGGAGYASPVPTTRVAAALACAALLSAAAGCGSSGKPSGSDTPAATSPAAAPTAAGSAGSSAPTASVAPFPSAAASTAGSRALWTISDFPTGWASAPDTSPGASDKADAALAKCLHVPVSVVTGKGDVSSVRANSPDFNAPSGNATASEIVTVSTTSRVVTLMTALKSPAATGCLGALLDTAVKVTVAQSTNPILKQATIGSVQVGQLSTGHYGDDTVAFRVSVPLTAESLSVTAYLDEIYIRRANAVASLTFEDVFSAFDTTIETQLAATAANKLAAVDIPAA